MKIDLCKEIDSSFLSCEKDIETILRKLFIDNPKYAKMLKRLLVINTKDCIDDMNDETYNKIIDNKSIADLYHEGYILTAAKLFRDEHPEVKAYIHVHMPTYTINETNPKFRDCIIAFDVYCYTDYWDLGDYRQRPLKIIGIIDGILNESRLSGLGTLNFIGANELFISNEINGWTLRYRAVHGSDDWIERE